MKQTSTGLRAAVVATALLLGGSVLLAPGAADAAKPKPKPVSGKVTKTVPMTCSIFGTDFDYDAKIVLSGKRASKTAKPIALNAKMSDMPGIAPVSLDYGTNPKLTLKVGSKTAVLSGKGHIDVANHEPAPIAPMKGAAKVAGSSLAVSVVKFDYHVLNADGTELTTIPCTPKASGALGKLKLK